MKIAAQVIILSLVISMLGSCSSGWSVGGFNDSTYTFVEILDKDSISHFYSDNLKINSDNWCLTHNQWELVKENE